MIGVQKITRIMILPFNVSIAYDNLHEFALLMALIFKLGIKQLPTATYLQEKHKSTVHETGASTFALKHKQITF